MSDEAQGGEPKRVVISVEEFESSGASCWWCGKPTTKANGKPIGKKRGKAPQRYFVTCPHCGRKFTVGPGTG